MPLDFSLKRPGGEDPKNSFLQAMNVCIGQINASEEIIKESEKIILSIIGATSELVRSITGGETLDEIVLWIGESTDTDGRKRFKSFLIHAQKRVDTILGVDKKGNALGIAFVQAQVLLLSENI